MILRFNYFKQTKTFWLTTDRTEFNKNWSALWDNYILSTNLWVKDIYLAKNNIVNLSQYNNDLNNRRRIVDWNNIRFSSISDSVAYENKTININPDFEWTSN